MSSFRFAIRSRAIMSYLADQYGKNVRLYPQTPIGRALVNHRLHFDIGTLYRGMKDYYVSIEKKKCIYIYNN